MQSDKQINMNKRQTDSKMESLQYNTTAKLFRILNHFLYKALMTKGSRKKSSTNGQANRVLFSLMARPLLQFSSVDVFLRNSYI